MNKICVYKETSEDWYPSFETNGKSTVEVSIFKIRWPLNAVEVKRSYRVAVWGMDDFGMYYDTEVRGIAVNTFRQVTVMKDVTKAALKELGFVTV